MASSDIDELEDPFEVRSRREPRTGALPWWLLFAVPILDVHCPCRLHRLEAMAAIPLQSSSGFVDVEILAKATFLDHLIDEVRVPALAALPARATWGDFVEVFRRP